MSSALAIGAAVKTSYGSGHVVAYNEVTRIYTIEVSSWVLSGSSRVFVYAQNDAITHIESVPSAAEAAATEAVPAAAAAPAAAEEHKLVAEDIPAATSTIFTQKIATGTAVKTVYGPAKVVEYNAHNGIYEVVFTKWVLSNGQTAHAFVTESNLTVDAAAPAAESSASAAAPAAAPAVEVKAEAEAAPAKAASPTKAAAAEKKEGEAAKEEKDGKPAVAAANPEAGKNCGCIIM
jgi:hypothetical protein